MSRESEMILKELQKMLDEHGDDIEDEKDLDAFLQQITENPDFWRKATKGPETADDYIELAWDAPSKKKHIEYLEKALELEPENLEAGIMLAQIQIKDPTEFVIAAADLKAKGDRQMEREGHFREDMGEFWLVLETRPYMRVCFAYMQGLVACGMMEKAKAECIRMLELCENDNLGVRHNLMHLYAQFEEEEAALALHKRYGERDVTGMLLPLSVLYYKKGDLDKAKVYLDRLAKRNKDTKKFIRAAEKEGLDVVLERVLEAEEPYGYRPNTEEELAEHISGNQSLYVTMGAYFQWANKQLKTTRKKSERT